MIAYYVLLITSRSNEYVSISFLPPSPHPVAKGRSLFGDPTSEIQELTQVIKQDLAKLNTDIADLQQQVKARSHRETKNMRTHSSSVVVSLQVSGSTQPKIFQRWFYYVHIHAIHVLLVGCISQQQRNRVRKISVSTQKMTEW